MIHSSLRLGPVAYLHRRLRAACANWLARGNARTAPAQIACFPRDYIGKLIVANGAYEDLILRCLFETTFARRRDQFRGGIVLDVGANIGNHSAWFARYFAEVIAFEPNPICVHLFEAGRLMNATQNVRLVPRGLSDRDTIATLHANLHGNLGGSHLGEKSADGTSHTFEVQLQRGDDVLANESLPVRLVKLDVEGHEHAVLRGLEQTLRRDQPIVLFESSGTQGADGSLAILETLRAWNYRHTYVIEADADRGGNRLARFGKRLLQGYRLQVSEVERPADRYYSLIIATVDAL